MSAFQSPQMVTEPFPKVVDDYRKQGMHHAKDLIHGKDMHHGKDMLHGKDMNHPKDVAFRTRSSSGATVAVDEATGDVDDKKLGDTTHQVISSLFIGPRSENMPYFKENIGTILSELEMARARYFPGDGAKDGKWITPEVQNSPAFKKSKDKLSKAVQKTANLLGRSSIPFWSPRYEAHMCTDMTMASLLGYFMTMLYNPNNVALEASPLSTVAEIEVGEQLCTLFGYNIDETDTDTPTGWGHVTCDGTVANLESMCYAARNLKYYPLALHKAMDKDQPLEFIRPKLFVETCQGDWKLFSSLEPWDLLNLKPKDVLDIPDRLYQEFGISNTFLSKVMNQFTVQSTGKDSLERLYTLDKPAQYLLANTRHYSWPKSAAIAGIGSDNVVGVPVDNAARIDIGKLEEMLNKKLEEQQPVYAVVAIMGSTEEGAVDPLSSVLALRKQFQAKGMSFLVHGDAAWGGYFCSMLPKDYHPGDIINLPTEMGDADGFVPDASLRAETQEDLFALRFADSITVDPHKAGYIPYPAGGLCYRDARMRFLVTWTSPYLSRGSVTSIGIYGVEGSKPGAAAVSTWLSNKTVGLNQEGYGSLLAEVTWTCTRFSAEWAVLSDANSPFVCVPFNELPSERDPNRSERKVENEKRRIRKEIINKPNSQIIAEDRNRKPEAKATKLMRALGSDLNINAFALNFRNRHDNKLNDDVEEANYLMKLVIEELSVDSPDDDPTKIPLYLTSTEFSDELYGDCKKHFMKRLGLEEDNTQDLMVLRNVVMSPFPSDGLFIHTLVSGVFKKVVEDATKIVQDRNELGEDFHNFLIQGSDDIHLVHLPLFHEANHRQQLIVKADFENVKSKSKDKYLALKRSSPNEPMILVTQRKTMLKEIVESKGTFTGQIMTKESGIILRNIPVTITNTVVSRPLNSKWRLPNYPEKNMPFYLYGNKEGINIDHVIARAPNTQLSASGCQIDFELNWDKPYVALLTDVREDAMQPFPPNNEIGSRHGAILGPKQKHAGDSNSSGGDGAAPFVITSETRDGKSRRSRFFFRPGAKFRVVVHEDGDRGNENVKYATSELGPLVAEGTLTVGDTVFVDSEAMNQDRYKKESNVNQWRHEFDQIGKDLD